MQRSALRATPTLEGCVGAPRTPVARAADPRGGSWSTSIISRMPPVLGARPRWYNEVAVAGVRAVVGLGRWRCGGCPRRDVQDGRPLRHRSCARSNLAVSPRRKQSTDPDYSSRLSPSGTRLVRTGDGLGRAPGRRPAWCSPRPLSLAGCRCHLTPAIGQDFRAAVMAGCRSGRRPTPRAAGAYR